MTLAPELLRQYEAARTSAVVFNLSDYAKIQLSGRDARTFLHNLCTNDVKNLQPGQGCEAFLTTNKAKVVAHVFVSCVQMEGNLVLWLDSVPGTAETVAAHLNRFLISEEVEISDRTAELSLFHVCGPAAEASGPLVRRNDRLALPGFDVFCEKAQAGEVRSKLVGPTSGPEVFEILRIEAGLPVYGKDIDAERFVMEVNRTAQAISFSKGCYLGQEPIVMARDRGHVNRFLMGVQMTGYALPSGGTKLRRDGVEVGEVTSSTFSPKLAATVCLAYLRRGANDPGTSLNLDDGRDAVVVSLPI